MASSTPSKKSAKKQARKPTKKPTKDQSSKTSKTKEKALEDYNSGQVTQVVPAPIVPAQPQNFERRVDLLEQQVKYLMEKMTILDAQVARSKGLEDPRLIQEAKGALRALFKPGESRTIDEIVAHPSMQQYPREMLDRAVVTLVDDEVFDVSEGTSKLKVHGYIARLIRR